MSERTSRTHLLTCEAVCEHLGISRGALERYEQLGLIAPRRADGERRYGPAEIRQAWCVVSLHRDLGINLAGVEAILRMRRQLLDAHEQVRLLLKLVQRYRSQLAAGLNESER